ncbi:MAG: hypothetical protein K2Z81_24635 [Cyanobacteria bacterium]|nr:hypothetical protein [Cyanobacteriota bacterium]
MDFSEICTALKDYEVTRRESLKRYFVTVRVENFSLSFDPVKHLRNMANSHEITFEVPREVYEKKSNAWNPSVNLPSLFWKGNFGALTGTIIKRWSENDSHFELVDTKEGRDLIVPRSKLQCEWTRTRSEPGTNPVLGGSSLSSFRLCICILLCVVLAGGKNKTAKCTDPDHSFIGTTQVGRLLLSCVFG